MDAIQDSLPFMRKAQAQKSLEVKFKPLNKCFVPTNLVFLVGKKQGL